MICPSAPVFASSRPPNRRHIGECVDKFGRVATPGGASRPASLHPRPCHPPKRAPAWPRQPSEGPRLGSLACRVASGHAHLASGAEGGDAVGPRRGARRRRPARSTVAGAAQPAVAMPLRRRGPNVKLLMVRRTANALIGAAPPMHRFGVISPIWRGSETESRAPRRVSRPGVCWLSQRGHAGVRIHPPPHPCA